MKEKGTVHSITCIYEKKKKKKNTKTNNEIKLQL